MIFIILAMLFYTIAVLLISAASRHANTNLVTAIVNTISALIPIIIVMHLASKRTLHDYKFGIIMSVLGGVAIALFGLALSKSFSVNKVGIVTPIVFGGAIFLSTILSYFIFKEKISILQGLGLVILAAGFIIIIYARATGR